jgi:hypothetical protein
VEQPPQKVTRADADRISAVISLQLADSPVRQVGIVLVYHGRRGHTFTVAWASAMRSLPRDDESAEWREIFHAQRDQWQASYEARFSQLVSAA